MTETAEKYETGRDTQAKDTDMKRVIQPDLQTQMLRKHLGSQVTIFMKNGIRLDGQLTGFDRYVIVLDGKLMSYKSAISTIMPGGSKPRQDRERRT